MDTEADIEVELSEEEPQKKGPFARYWDRVGGGSFTISVLVHAVFVVVALLIIWRTNTEKDPENIEFLSGGGNFFGQDRPQLFDAIRFGCKLIDQLLPF